MHLGVGAGVGVARSRGCMALTPSPSLRRRRAYARNPPPPPPAPPPPRCRRSVRRALLQSNFATKSNFDRSPTAQDETRVIITTSWPYDLSGGDAITALAHY